MGTACPPPRLGGQLVQPSDRLGSMGATTVGGEVARLFEGLIGSEGFISTPYTCSFACSSFTFTAPFSTTPRIQTTAWVLVRVW